MVHTSLSLSGAVAQYGRGVGIIQATAAQLINQFAKCLEQQLARDHQAATLAPSGAQSPPPVQPARPPAPAPAPASAPKPISGFALMARVVWSWVTGLFRRS
jgi:hypothetical protein